MNYKKSTLFMIIFLVNGVLFSQKSDYNGVNQLIEDGKNYTAIRFLKEKINSKLSESKRAETYYYLAKAYGNESRHDVSYNLYIKSQNIYLSIDSVEKAMDIKLDLAYLFSTQKQNFNTAKKILKEYIDYAEKTKNPQILAKAYYKWASLIMDENPIESRTYFLKALRNIDKSHNESIYSNIVNNYAVLNNEKLNKQDSALFYYKKSLEIAEKKNDVNSKCISIINIAGVYYYKGNNNKAIDLLKQADELPITKLIANTKKNIHFILSLNYEAIGDYKNAFESMLKSTELAELNNINEQEKNISEQKVQNETQEKELENVNLKTNIKTNKIISFSSIGLLLVIIIVSILAYKNLSKKKKIIEQEKQLETQKLETTLKEQELHEIDVMLESQEKERQRIANELHDNLGSMLTTLKHNFENLKRNDTTATDKEKDLFLKTDSLIDEAYQEVRNIAHLKNLGVIGSEGLVIAVKKMAEKMSVIEKLHINVIPHGLNERLENTIEVMLFRMIQELCTNIIKHSEATEVNIYLTQHNNNELNIIIEDNGIGFDSKNAVSTSGIGLKSIEKKVEQMNGTFTIDSIVSKGTTIIIDLPI